MQVKFSGILLEITSTTFPQNPDLALIQAERMWEISKPIDIISLMCGLDEKVLRMLATGLEWKRVKKGMVGYKMVWPLVNN